MAKAEVKFANGDACNFRNKSAAGEFTLHGDPEVKVEKPYTIVHFPGGSVEISRTSDGDYWAHIAVQPEEAAPSGDAYGEVVGARLDVAPPDYVSEALDFEINSARFRHVAVRIRQRRKAAPRHRERRREP